jgi:hypothetical protein
MFACYTSNFSRNIVIMTESIVLAKMVVRKKFPWFPQGCKSQCSHTLKTVNIKSCYDPTDSNEQWYFTILDIFDKISPFFHPNLPSKAKPSYLQIMQFYRRSQKHILTYSAKHRTAFGSLFCPND